MDKDFRVILHFYFLQYPGYLWNMDEILQYPQMGFEVSETIPAQDYLFAAAVISAIAAAVAVENLDARCQLVAVPLIKQPYSWK